MVAPGRELERRRHFAVVGDALALPVEVRGRLVHVMARLHGLAARTQHGTHAQAPRLQVRVVDVLGDGGELAAVLRVVGGERHGLLELRVGAGEVPLRGAQQPQMIGGVRRTRLAARQRLTERRLRRLHVAREQRALPVSGAGGRALEPGQGLRHLEEVAAALLVGRLHVGEPVAHGGEVGLQAGARLVVARAQALELGADLRLPALEPGLVLREADAEVAGDVAAHVHVAAAREAALLGQDLGCTPAAGVAEVHVGLPPGGHHRHQAAADERERLLMIGIRDPTPDSRQHPSPSRHRSSDRAGSPRRGHRRCGMQMRCFAACREMRRAAAGCGGPVAAPKRCVRMTQPRVG